jgi:hypothetical protein
MSCHECHQATLWPSTPRRSSSSHPPTGALPRRFISSRPSLIASWTPRPSSAPLCKAPVSTQIIASKGSSGREPRAGSQATNWYVAWPSAPVAGGKREATYRSCAEKSSLVSSSSHDSSQRCCVSPPLAASVSSASQSARGDAVSHNFPWARERKEAYPQLGNPQTRRPPPGRRRSLAARRRPRGAVGTGRPLWRLSAVAGGLRRP